MAIKTSAKFDKTVRDAKDTVVNFYHENQAAIDYAIELLTLGAAVAVWARVAMKIGYNQGYAQGAVDAMRVGIELGWYRPEVMGK